MTRTAELHQQAMALADRALIESMKSNNSSAPDLYNQAFALERDAAIEARTSGAGEPTISVLHRSAATLALDAGQVREAERLVAAALALDPPDALADELRDLLEQVHFRRHLSLRGLELNPGEFQFTLIGPAVGFGMVASDEFVSRVQTFETLLYRTAERKLEQPFRDRGRRKQSIQQKIDLYVSVPRAASFAVTFRIGSNTQGRLFPGGGFGEQLVDEVLTCVEMLNRGDDESIRRRIGEPSYYRNFIGLVAKIAPDGENITGIGFTTVDVGGTPREVALRRSKESLPTPEPLEVATTRPAAEDKPLVITGRLGFASNMDQSNEIRIATDAGSVYRVEVPAGLMSDIVKPLWNELVTVRGTRRADDVVLLAAIDPAE